MASQFIGERYVPQHEGEWDTSLPYDRLSIVTVTTGDNVDAYISRVPVPVGTPITDNNYWALLYISRITSGGSASVSWVDIENKPDTFPPSAHTQDWDTITGKPNTFPPSAHNQAISTIQGLQTTLNDLQDQINAGGGGGAVITTGTFGPGNALYPSSPYTLLTYADGYMEFSTNITMTVNLNTSLGDWWQGTPFNNAIYPFPVPFTEIPVLTVSVQSSLYNLVPAMYGSSKTTHLPTTRILSAVKADNAPIVIGYTARGY